MLDGVSFLVVGGYVAVVLWKGNIAQLVNLLGGELGFVEWAIAIAAIGAVYNSKALGPVGRGLVALSVVGLGYKVVANPNVQSVISNMKSGQDFLTAIKNGATGTGGQGNLPALPSLPGVQ